MKKDIAILAAIVLLLMALGGGALLFLGGPADIMASITAPLEIANTLETMMQGEAPQEDAHVTLVSPGAMTVNTVLCTDYEEKDGYVQLYDLFSWCYTGSSGISYAYADISNSPGGEVRYRLVFTDPDGESLHTSEVESYSVAEEGDGFYQIFEVPDLMLEKPGMYQLSFQVQTSGGFVTVGTYPLKVRQE